MASKRPQEGPNEHLIRGIVSVMVHLRLELTTNNVTLDDISFRKLFNLYLLSSYTYYREDRSFLPDPLYDAMCKNLLSRLPESKSPFFYPKELVDREALESGSGYHIGWNNIPIPLLMAANRLCSTGEVDWGEDYTAERVDAAPMVKRKRKRKRVEVEEVELPKKRRARQKVKKPRRRRASL